MKINNIEFDDVVITDDNKKWSQICESCREKYNLANNDDYSIDYNVGYGICGIVGCNNESDHYIDFIGQIDCINKHFGSIDNLAERKQIIKELTSNGYEVKFNCRAARNINENITVFYNPDTFKHMLLFNDNFTDFYCEAYFAEGSIVKL